MRVDARPALVASCLALLLLLAGPEAAAKRRKKPKPPPVDPIALALQERADEFRSQDHVHGPLRQLQCAPCHVSAEEPAALKAEVPGLCFGCHENRRVDMGKPNLHFPFESGECTGCHDPHGSGYPYLLSDEVNGVCTMCHDITDDPVRSSHRGIVVESVTCNTCHTPHGSDREKLIWETGLHPPFEMQACEACHADASPEGEVRFEGDGTEVCLACHMDKEEDLEKNTVHPPFGAGECWFCHEPHHTKGQRSFLKEPPQTLCRVCHDIAEVGHPVAFHPTSKPGVMHPVESEKPFDCAGCHNPHASEFSKLRRKDPLMALCQWCHSK